MDDVKFITICDVLNCQNPSTHTDIFIFPSNEVINVTYLWKVLDLNFIIVNNTGHKTALKSGLFSN